MLGLITYTILVFGRIRLPGWKYVGGAGWCAVSTHVSQPSQAMPRAVLASYRQASACVAYVMLRLTTCRLLPISCSTAKPWANARSVVCEHVCSQTPNPLDISDVLRRTRGSRRCARCCAHRRRSW